MQFIKFKKRLAFCSVSLNVEIKREQKNGETVWDRSCDAGQLYRDRLSGGAAIGRFFDMLLDG